MPIDDCPHDFGTLAAKILPGYMQQLRSRMETPLPMAKFSEARVGVRTLLQRLNKEDDFSGCYVLVDLEDPIYVGISRSVVSRLRQHVRGRSHFDASLAYRVACTRHDHQLTRSAAMQLEQFRRHFAASQEYLKSLGVAYIEIDNPLELYLFEAYAAMELDTCVWNTFATH